MKKWSPKAYFRGVLKGLRQKLSAYLNKRFYKSFRLNRKPSPPGGQPLPPFLHHLRDCLVYLWREKWLYLKITTLHAVVGFVIVGSLSQVDFIDLRQSVGESFAGHTEAIGQTATLLAAAMGGLLDSRMNELQQFSSGLVAFIFWLAIVWATRMRLAGQAVTMRDALYNGGAPLVSSTVVFGFILFQMLPGALGALALSSGQSMGWFNGGVETMLFSIAALLSALLSLYWLAGSLMAMVVVTLPKMYPWQALSAASELVIGQRWALALRIVALGVIIFLLWVIVMVPVLMLENWLKFDWLPLAPIAAHLLSAVTLVFFSVYVYKLYRSLL